MLLPLLALLALGGGIYLVTRPSSQAATTTPPADHPYAVLDQTTKEGIFKELGSNPHTLYSGTQVPGLGAEVAVVDQSASTFVDAAKINSPVKDAFGAIVAANMGTTKAEPGNQYAVLLSKGAANELVLYFTPASNIATIAPYGSTKAFVFLLPGEAASLIAKLGLHAAAPQLTAGPAAQTSSSSVSALQANRGAASAFATPGSGGATRALPGEVALNAKNIGRLASTPMQSAGNRMQSAASAATAAMDLGDVPYPAVQTAIGSRQASTMMSWYDKLFSLGYSNAAAQLLQIARNVGWAPRPGDHRELMQYNDLYNQYYMPGGKGSNWQQIPDILPYNTMGLINVVQEAHSAPTPNTASVLAGYRDALAKAGYTTAAGELGALQASIGF